MKKAKSITVIMSMTMAIILFIQTNVNARGMFSTFKQRIVYASSDTEAEGTVNKNGISFKYKSSGSDPIGVQDYCGFWFIDYCDPDKVNDVKIWDVKPT